MSVSDYRFKTAPYEHQLAAWERSKDEAYWALLLEMGTGKSKVLLDTIGHLAAHDEIRAALIVAPKGVYMNWVSDQIPKHLDERLAKRVLAWNSAPGKARDAEKAQLLRPGDFAILVMNIEALSTAKGFAYAQAFLRAHRCLFAIDESTTIKNATSKRTKNCVRLGRLAPYRRILTGSPITKSPLDAYTQTEFLKPGALGFSSIYSFRNRYAETEKDYVTGGDGKRREFTVITGFRRLEELNRKLMSFSSRVLKKDCLDLPDKVYQVRHVELTDEQRRAYAEMRDEGITLIRNAEKAGEPRPAVAQVAITQILRLHQILCGHLTTIDGDVVELPSNRVDELLEVLEEVEGKALIWANYRHDHDVIRRALVKAYGSDSVAVYSGETRADERPVIVQRLQDPNDPLRWFVGQPRTGGYGLTLTGASTVVYYSNNWDLEVRLQSEDRAHRIGQTNKVNYVDLMVPGTVDEKIVRALNAKLSLAAQVMGEGWKEWLV